ncbi:MAG: type II toxin-antitoxin system Phd/YefM family antitoxin [Vulcanimicrobiaceae bacterium]
MRTLGIAEGKDRFSEIVDQAESGQTIIITRKGKPVAELRPISARADAADVVARILARKWTLGCSIRDLIREGRK